MGKFVSYATAVAAISITFFNFSCTDSSGGPNATIQTSVLTDKVVVLRDGYQNYSGTRDTTVYKDASDWTSLGVVGSAPTATGAGSAIDTGASPTQRSYGLISFNVSGLTSDMLNSGEICATQIEVLRADLDLFLSAPNNSYVSVSPLKSSAPPWTESEATYVNANNSDLWTAGGAHPNTPILNDTDLGSFDAFDGVPNSAIYRHVTFRIPTDTVLDWVCDSTKNKGMLISIGSSTTEKALFFTREFPSRTYRPMLTIYLKRL